MPYANVKSQKDYTDKVRSELGKLGTEYNTVNHIIKSILPYLDLIKY